MAALDPRTIIFVSVLIYCLLAVAMVVFNASLKGQRGPGYWAAGTCGWALCGYLLLLRGVLPAWLTVVVANVGLVSSLSLLSHGLAVLLGQKPRYWLHCLVGLANLLGFCYFGLIHDDLPARVIMISLAFMVLAAEMALRFWPLEAKPRNPTSLLVFFTLVAAILFQGIRLVATVYVPSHDLFQGSTITAMALLFFPLSVVALTFSLLALAASRFARQKDEANAEMAEANRQLQSALDNVKTLSGLLPICANCKKIRDDHGYWQKIEAYLMEHTEVDFTHGICPECAQLLYGDIARYKTATPLG